MTANRPAIILITDPTYPVEHISAVVEQVAAALPAGALMVQVRDKTSPFVRMRAYAKALRDVTRRVGALLALNAIRKLGGQVLDLAAEIEADGLHVTCQSVNIAAGRDIAKWVSVPVHDANEARAAALGNADAMLVSPIFPTPGKPRPRGIGALAEAAGFNRGRIYALGGVAARQAPMCADAGAHGVAVIRALLDAEDPAAVARALAAPFGEV